MMSNEGLGDFVGLSSEIEDVARGFDRPGQYSYEIARQETGAGLMGWDVSEQANGDIVVGFRYELEEQTLARNVTGSPRKVSSGLLATSARPYLRGTFYPCLSRFIDEDTLSTGDRISLPVENGTGSVEITDAPTYAGIECSTAIWRHNGNIRLRNCLAPKWGLVFYAAVYPVEGMEPLLEVELNEHSAIDSGR